MSNNLLWRELAPTQNQKEVTINEQKAILDAALTERLDLTGGGSFVLTNKQFTQNAVFQFDGDSDVTIPNIKKAFFIDNTSGTVPLDLTKGTTTVQVPNGAILGFYSGAGADDLTVLSGFTVDPQPYETSIFFPGTPASSELIAAIVFNRDVAFQGSFLGSKCIAQTATTAAYTIDVLKNGSSLGVITFGSSDDTGSYTGISSTTFAPGDELKLVGSASADATLADIAFLLVGAFV